MGELSAESIIHRVRNCDPGRLSRGNGDPHIALHAPRQLIFCNTCSSCSVTWCASSFMCRLKKTLRWCSLNACLLWSPFVACTSGPNVSALHFPDTKQCCYASSRFLCGYMEILYLLVGLRRIHAYHADYTTGVFSFKSLWWCSALLSSSMMDSFWSAVG